MLHYQGLSYRISQTSISSMHVIFFLIGQNMFWFIYAWDHSGVEKIFFFLGTWVEG
jgi:hypothetical protein